MRLVVACVVLSACGLTLAADKMDPKSTDLDHMQGAWVVSDTKGFKDTLRAELKDLKLVIKDHEMTGRYGDKSIKATFTVKETTTPQQMDVKIVEGPDEV